jgi:plasmid stabilization system protein ParE
VQYLFRLTDRAFRDFGAIYEFIEADSSESAFAWFNGLAEAIHSLERFAERGSPIPEDKKLHHLLFGKKPNMYRIIYALDKRKNSVDVLHIRHGAMAPLSPEQETQP